MERALFIEKKDEFLTQLEVERNLSIHTIRAYAGDLNQFIAFWERLTPYEQKELGIRHIIERYLMVLFYKNMNKSSIARKFSCFRSFEKFLERSGIKLNLKLQRPRVEKKLPVYLTMDEMFHLLDNIPNDQLPTRFPARDKAILELLYATGVRCSELIQINIQDVQMESLSIRIKGKGRKERMVLFGKKAQEKLMTYFQTERFDVRNTDEPLFTNYRGARLTSRSIQRIIEMFRSFLKIERPITPHKIRHSFATHLLNQGADLRTIQELLGHKTLSSTEKYTHVSLKDLKTMMNTIHPIDRIMKKNKQ